MRLRWWGEPARVDPLPVVDAALPTRAELVALRARVVGRPSPRAPVAGAGTGTHRSLRTGRGLEFAELRPYQPGDDVRSIDWRHTARRGRTYTKTFHDERERPLLLFVDMSASMRFGTRVAFKSVAAARAAAVLAWSASGAGDRVGGVVVSGGARAVSVPAQRLDAGVLALIRALAPERRGPADAGSPGGGPQRAAAGVSAPDVEALARVAPPDSHVVLLSDFHHLDAEAERALQHLAARRVLSLVQVFDPIEADPPPPGLYRVADRCGQRVLDLQSADARAAYARPFRERSERLAALANRLHAPLMRLATDDDPWLALHALAARPAR